MSTPIKIFAGQSVLNAGYHNFNWALVFNSDGTFKTSFLSLLYSSFGGAAGRVPYYDASGNLTSGVMLFDGSSFTVPKIVFTATEITLLGNTADGADNQRMTLAPAGASGSSRAGRIQIAGNEHADLGTVTIIPGGVAGGLIDCVLNDNQAGAFKIREGANNYLTADTTNGSERINFGVAVRLLNGSTNLDYYEEGTFTATLTGVTTTVTGTARYVHNGGIVDLFLPTLSGLSNTNACTITGLPASIRPARIKFKTVGEVRDNGNSYPGAIRVDTGGSVTLFFHSTVPAGLTSVFTNANTKGLTVDSDITYNLV